MRRKDFRSLNSALLEQGWTLEATNNGHTKAIPPDRDKQIVLYSPSSDPRAFKNVLHRLRRSGFVSPLFSGSGAEKETDAVEKEVTADESEAKREVEMVQEQASKAANSNANSVDPDQLFRDLKEARTYAALAKEALAESQQKYNEAEEALRGSEEEYDRAIKQMNQCKSRFDKAFQDDGL